MNKPIKKKRNGRPTCSTCGKKLEQSIVGVQNHFLKEHNSKLSEGEAFQMLAKKGSKKTIYTEGLSRNYNEVQGGAPSLGKNN